MIATHKVAWLLVGSMALAASVHAASVAGDFSATSNPNGQWQYGYETSLGTGFTLLGFSMTIGSDFERWQRSPSSADPGVFYNAGAAPLAIYDFVLQPHAAAFHPGPLGEFSVVRWTAPEDADYVLASSFEGLGLSSTTDVHVLVDGTETFSHFLSGRGSAAQYSTTLTLRAGDTVDFALGWGANRNYGADTTGISATINPLSVPEPATGGLLLAALAGATLGTRRR